MTADAPSADAREGGSAAHEPRACRPKLVPHARRFKLLACGLSRRSSALVRRCACCSSATSPGTPAGCSTTRSSRPSRPRSPACAEQYRHRRHPPARHHRRAPLARARRLALPRHHAGRRAHRPATSARCRPAPSTGRARARSPTAAATTSDATPAPRDRARLHAARRLPPARRPRRRGARARSAT